MGTIPSFSARSAPQSRGKSCHETDRFDAIKEAGADGLVWDEANLAEYLRAPKEKIPGNKMAFAGLKDDADIANVIAYLAADPKP